MGSGNGGEPTLASSSSDKKRASKYMEEQLMPDTQSAGRMADGGGAASLLVVTPATPASPLMKQDTGLKGFCGWATDEALSDALTVWEGQVNRLMGRLQRELTGLHGTKNILQSQDTIIGAQVDGVRLPSSFDAM